VRVLDVLALTILKDTLNRIATELKWADGWICHRAAFPSGVMPVAKSNPGNPREGVLNEGAKPYPGIGWTLNASSALEGLELKLAE
jgi:hypothetical protein